MQSKIKGNTAELIIASQLSALGYAVFRELGDSAPVDLIVLVKNRPVKVQVKSCCTSLEKPALWLSPYRTSGGRYVTKYAPGEVDVFACYDHTTGTTIYVLADYVLSCDSMSFRLIPAKHGNGKTTRWVGDYADFNALV